MRTPTLRVFTSLLKPLRVAVGAYCIFYTSAYSLQLLHLLVHFIVHLLLHLLLHLDAYLHLQLYVPYPYPMLTPPSKSRDTVRSRRKNSGILECSGKSKDLDPGTRCAKKKKLGNCGNCGNCGIVEKQQLLNFPDF